jgi:hypothetical protein
MSVTAEWFMGTKYFAPLVKSRVGNEALQLSCFAVHQGGWLWMGGRSERFIDI